jgi:hypothetical protein
MAARTRRLIVLCDGGGQLSLAEIEAEIPDILTSHPGYLSSGMQILGAMAADFKRLQDHADSDDWLALSYTVKMLARSRVRI